ncbi:MAG: hypothetical protein R2800_09795 [Flavipsychrobacter sp.]
MSIVGLPPYITKKPDASNYERFLANVANDGGIVETALAMYHQLPDDVLDANILLVPGAYKSDTLYCFQKFSPYYKATLSRPGTATRVNALGQVVLTQPNVPRIEYDLANNKSYLLLERQSTNLVENTVAFDNLNIGQANREVVATSAPYADATVLKFTRSFGGAAYAYIRDTGHGVGYRTISLMVKKIDGDSNKVGLYAIVLGTRQSDSANVFIGIDLNFNFDTKEITAVYGGGQFDVLRNEEVGYQELTDGWYRLHLTFEIYNMSYIGQIYAGTGSYSTNQPVGTSVLVSCFQFEIGRLTSYKPTYGIQVTQPADELLFTALQAQGAFADNKGTLFMSAVLSPDYDVHLDDGNDDIFRISKAGMSIVGMFEEILPVATNDKAGYKWEYNEKGVVVTAGAVTEELSENTAPMVVERLRILPTNDRVCVFHIALYNRLVKNSILQTLTT